MTDLERLLLAIILFVISLAVLRWKRPTLWAKLTKPFRRKPKP